MESKYQELYDAWHKFAIEAEQIRAQITIDLDNDGVAHGLKELVEAKYIKDHNKHCLEFGAAARELQLYIGSREEKNLEYMRVMAEAAQASLDREKEYIDRAERIIRGETTRPSIAKPKSDGEGDSDS